MRVDVVDAALQAAYGEAGAAAGSSLLIAGRAGCRRAIWRPSWPQSRT